MSTGGLRELKKKRTREAIQDHALRLYREQGYANTTLEEVAAAAEVSPSTLFRYFPTKPDTVLFDRVDPIFIEKFLAEPAELPPLQAARNALVAVLNSTDVNMAALETTRMKLIATVPELRAAVVTKVETDMPPFIEAFARRIGRAPDDPRVRYWTGAVAGVAVMAYLRAVDNDEDIYTVVDEALEFLDNGMPL
ncbi:MULTISPECIES: TetR/AcrR family transcriptional regulator [Nocardia]|uniref:TetR/AcrR family transcriptional regulator n=1 Tax=Nocardia TaxID=1817 RepID=UPI0018930DB0|nr:MULTISPECIES: TetR family transcriptional regulator [Nocardia]MBF6349950.1 TetR family transcriptional regulator [Nocardia flavorosea]